MNRDALARWIISPRNNSLVLLGMCFLVAVVLSIFGTHFAPTVIFFPNNQGKPQGELHNLPVKWSVEDRAELVASETLLGPINLTLKPDFPTSAKVESVLFRKGVLYIDFSPDTGLNSTDNLRIALTCLYRSLESSIPFLGRIVVTFGGVVPDIPLKKAAPKT